jgi:hypothetical protein
MGPYRDYYDSKRSPWYWVLQVCVTLYGLGAFAYLVLLQNVHIPDTVFDALPGGRYYTGRYITFAWYAIMLSAASLVVYPAINALVLFRGSKGCSVFWFGLLVALTFLQLVVVVGLAEQYGKCNQGGQHGNLCNDPRWCCSPAIFTVTSNGCFNTVPCPDYPSPKLVPNTDFLWIFWSNFFFFFADLLLMLYFGLVFFCCPVYGLRKTDVGEEE